MTFSPVVRFTSIRMKLKHFYAENAFFNGYLKDNIYMEQPVGFGDGTSKEFKLQINLCGFKQASRFWSQKFNKFIEVLGLKASKSDACVFTSNKENIEKTLYLSMSLTAKKSNKDGLVLLILCEKRVGSVRGTITKAEDTKDEVIKFSFMGSKRSVLKSPVRYIFE